VALAPLYVALIRSSARNGGWRRAFVLGAICGTTYFAGTVYWVRDVVTTYGGLAPALGVLVAIVLVLYLTIYPALAAILLDRLARVLGPRALVLAPAVWVTTELLRGRLVTAFPWVLLGYSQVEILPVAQAASVVGVYGVSVLVAAVSAAIAGLVVSGRKAVLPAVAVFASVGAIAVWGAWRLSDDGLTRAGRPLVVAVAQGNVPQDEKWDPAHGRDILARYLRLTRESARRGARLVIWPESSTPFFFEEEPSGRAAIVDAVRAAGVWLLLGSDEVDRGAPPRYYNAAFLVAPDGTVAPSYRKVHLVPFGEYVPFKGMLFFVAPLVESVSDFTAGEAPVLLPVDGARVSTAICYEAVFPELTGEAVDAGSALLTTITNDAWYGRSSAPYQHFQQARMRAVEQGRYLARAANTGISGIVDPYGRVLQQTRLFETVAASSEVRLLDGRTVYGKIGDSFTWAMVVLTLLALVATGRRRTAGAHAR
jgi:apolipoprotein N-acyltransferase